MLYVYVYMPYIRLQYFTIHTCHYWYIYPMYWLKYIHTYPSIQFFLRRYLAETKPKLRQEVVSQVQAYNNQFRDLVGTFSQVSSIVCSICVCSMGIVYNMYCICIRVHAAYISVCWLRIAILSCCINFLYILYVPLYAHMLIIHVLYTPYIYTYSLPKCTCLRMSNWPLTITTCWLR